MYKKFPETIVNFPFLPAGLSFGYIFFLPWIDEALYDSITFWPHFALLFSIVLTASSISIVKLSNGKYIFEHFKYLFMASVAFITAGILFVVLRDEYTYIALFICAISSGSVFISGLSYINIRSEKRERPMRIALCHVWKLIGFGIIFTVYIFNLTSDGLKTNETLESFYRIIGYVMIGSSTFFIVLLMLNEYRQRQGLIYNYKDCLDHDNSIANNYCKIFSKNEVIVENVASMSSSGMWRSSENLLGGNKKNFTNLWTLYLMITKLHGAVLFYPFLIIYTFQTSNAYVDDVLGQGVVVWLIALGSLLGGILLYFCGSAKVYTLASTLAIVTIGISYIFFSDTNNVISICLWIFFFFVSISVSIPDIALLEVAKTRYNEGALALGFFFEVIAIAVLQTILEKPLTQEYIEDNFIPYFIGVIVVLVVNTLIIQLHLPNTFNKSLLQIQNGLLKFKNYFAFYFDNEVSSELPRSPSDSNRYIESNNINVFEENAKKITIIEDPHLNEYSEIKEDKLPDPPVNNNNTNFDYNRDIPKPPPIIPRVNYFKERMSLYENE